MDVSTREALARIREAEAAVKRSEPLVLDEEYLRLVRRCEELECNRSGSDKSWVPRAFESAFGYPARARRK